jgi:hypothetical protein
MYEMEGALLWPRPASPAGCPSRPAPRAARRGQAPVSWSRFPGPFSRLWSYLQMVPVSDGESISTPLAGVAQESVAIHFKFVRCPRVTHRTNRFIRT